MEKEIAVVDPSDATTELARQWWPAYVRELREHGLPIDLQNNRDIQEYWDGCWDAGGRHPFIVVADGDFAGFAVTQDEPDPLLVEKAPDSEILEFFVIPKLRRLGVGKRAARLLFDQHPGGWQVFELAENMPARAFWENVIAEYTTGDYIGADIDDGEWRGRIQFFDNSPRRPRE